MVGGDWQCDPTTMAAAGFANRSGSTLVATRDPRGTCRSPIAATELDYYFIHNEMATGIKSIAIVEGAGTAPHLPVRLTFHPRLTTARTLILRQPPRLSTERVIGPIPSPPDWEMLRDPVDRLLDQARGDDFRIGVEFRRAYAKAFELWADLAEEEIIGATVSDGQSKKRGLRGREPVLIWRSVQAERPQKPPAHEAYLAQWRTLATVVGEIRCALYWLVPPDADVEDRLDEAAGAAGRRAPRSEMLGLPFDVLMARLQGIRDQMETEMTMGDEWEGVGALADDQGSTAESAETQGLVREKIVSIVGGIELALRASMASGDVARRARRASPLALRLLGIADALHSEVQGRLKEAADAHKAAAAAGWRDWVMENIAHGARNAHKFLRLHTDWRPTTALSIDGIATADPLQLLDKYVQKYDGLWNSPGVHAQEGRRNHHGEGGQEMASDKPWRAARTSPLPRPTPAQLRAASMSFSSITMVAYDGIALRHYSLMSDAALSYVADFIELLEITGELPPQLGLTAMPLIEKARGGHRAVASLVGLYRLWARLRKPVVGEWESRHERPYLAAGKGKSPQATVWRQACRSEAAVGRGRCSGTVLWDMASFFEAIKRVPLWHRARKLGFPLTVLKVALTTYESVRMLSLGGAMSAPLHSDDGVLAGCGFAMALTRAYVIPPLDLAVQRFGPATDDPADFDLFVDDAAISAEGTEQQVINRLTHAASVIKETIEGPLHCAIEVDKAAVVSSSRALTEQLRQRFGSLAGPVVSASTSRTSGARRPRTQPRVRAAARRPRAGPAVVNLGIDFAAGAVRRDHGVACKRKKRMKVLQIKTKRLLRIRGLAGRRTPLIFLAGPLPEAVYGASVNGVSDAEALQLRRCAAQAYSPRAKGRSLSRLLLIVGVPTWRAEVEVILEYARHVWDASLLGAKTPENGSMTLTEIARLWRAVDFRALLSEDGQRREWGAVRGPLGAMFLSLHRVGWKMIDPFTIINSDGDSILLTTTSPPMLATLLRHAVQRAIQSKVGKDIAKVDGGFEGRRAAGEHVAARLKADRTLTAKDRAAYMSVACRAVMTYSRAASMGYLVLDECPLCKKNAEIRCSIESGFASTQTPCGLGRQWCHVGYCRNLTVPPIRKGMSFGPRV